MKLFFFILCLFSLSGKAQDTTITLSKFEAFSGTPGKIFRTERGAVGKVRSIEIYMAQVTDVEAGTSQKAIEISQANPGTASTTIYVDFDEIDGLIKSLDYFRPVISKGNPQNALSLQYLTTNDVMLLCSYQDAVMLSGWNVTISKRYHHSRLPVPNSIIPVRNNDLGDLARLIAAAKTAKF